ncbi:VOC family protein [Homoserinimonas sp. OAct 916]|uniref:VOC family protein n=1 Tax=Homoserinimonas sp. OAct 916 TaxID=2211450 RepID=UPI000DBE36CC|nr:VOC family protein [Homoserinimonas sp. OAct 916]
MQKITPCLWFNGNAAEGAQFYTDLFPDSRVVTTSRYPDEGLPDFQKEMAGKVLAIDFELGGFRFTGINAGPEYPITPAISFMVNLDPSHDDDAEARLNELWAALENGGETLMPLGQYPHSTRYGWVQDRFGVSWQLMLANPGGERAPFIVPNLLFGGSAQNRAAEARAYYTSIFSDSRTATVMEYPEQTGPAAAGAVMFSDFTLAGQWFAAMDSRVEQSFSFTEGVSLVVTCADQDEIDRLWAALSEVPEAEQCGWCKDRFGVSWQIVPENMGELMSRPGAFDNMMAMKKLEIAGF